MNPIIDFEPSYELIAEQKEIGWQQLHLGRYSLSWLENKYDKRISGEPKWIQQVIRETWSFHHRCWKARNEQLHGPSTGQATSEATRLALLTRIRALYQHKPRLLVQDHFPFQTEIDHWDTKTNAAMKQWLTCNTPFIRKSQLKKHAADIRQFMPKAPITNT
jgi:hypothetical protein